MKSSKWVRTAMAAALVASFPACNAQEGQHHKVPTDKKGIVQNVDTPKVDIRVNKQYDDKGNLIAYDSTYSSVYNSVAGDSLGMDSLFQGFQRNFGQRFPFLNDPGFNDLFFQDTLMHNDFFHDDFFQKRMELNQRYMQRMMAEMDSLKQQYFRGQGNKAEKGAK